MIHGIRAYLTYDEAESAIVLDAALHPERLGHYKVMLELSEWCGFYRGENIPCPECRKYVGSDVLSS